MIIFKNTIRELNSLGKKSYQDSRGFQVAAYLSISSLKVRGKQSGCWTGCINYDNSIKYLKLYYFHAYLKIQYCRFISA